MISILIGNDTYAIEREVEKFKAQTHPLWRDFNIHRFDASSLDVAISAAASVPFGVGSKLIVVENCDFKQFGETGLELLQILPHLPTTTHLVFTAAVIDKRLKVVKHLLQFGKLKEFTLIPPWRTDLIESAIATTAKQMNLSIARDAVSYLAVAVGNDSARMVSELEKLAIYAAGERITKESALALVPATTANSFQLAEALLRGQASLIEQGVLHKSRDKLWAKGFPHKDVNFRGGTGASTVQLVDGETQEEIEILSTEIAYREVFPGAIYRTQNSDGCLVTYSSQSLLNSKAILQKIPETPLFTVAISRTDTNLKQKLSLPQQIPLVIPEIERYVQDNSTDSNAISGQAILELVWGEISQLVTGYQLLIRNYGLTCLNRKCVNYREPLSQCTACPVCGKRTRSAELTSVLNEVNFEQAYEIKFATPVLQISLNSPVELYLQQIATTTRQELLQSQQPIPPGYQQLWEYPPILLAIHSFGHQILAALPLTILASANDVNFLVEKRGANEYVGLFYDLAEGGSGTSEAIFRSLPQLAYNAAELARSCSCSSGCPKCLIHPGCPDGNKALLKQVGMLLCEAF